MGKTGIGKTGLPGENGFPGDKGVPEEDGEVEKAAQLLCSKEVLLWSSAGEEGVLRFQSSAPCTFPWGNPRAAESRDRTQYIPLDGLGREPGGTGNGAGSS